MVVGRSKIAAGIRGGRAGGADPPDESTGMRAVADPRRLRLRLSFPSSRTVSQAGADDGSGKNRQDRRKLPKQDQAGASKAWGRKQTPGGNDKFVLARNMVLTPELVQFVRWVGDTGLPAYICRFTGKMAAKGQMFFNKEFSSRCIDKSDKIIVLANAEWSLLKDAKIKVYRDGIARLTKGWKVFAETIGIRANDACLFSVRRFPRGLNATVFITRL